MKKLMTVLMISGVALMAQTGSAPASSSHANGSTSPAPTTKVRKHKKAKNATPAGSTGTNATTNSKPASK
ncbi:MAG TPA: hypothetical protein VGR73_01830 [Bryobacteraceae bacterium]|nr:hypothetical protein [Bryobacteraceae bacterium]